MSLEEFATEVLEAGSDMTARYACLFLFVISGLMRLCRSTRVRRTKPSNSAKRHARPPLGHLLLPLNGTSASETDDLEALHRLSRLRESVPQQPVLSESPSSTRHKRLPLTIDLRAHSSCHTPGVASMHPDSELFSSALMHVNADTSAAASRTHY